MVEGNVAFRVNLEAGIPEDVPEVETHSDPTRTLGSDEAFSVRNSIGQKMEDKYSGGGD